MATLNKDYLHTCSECKHPAGKNTNFLTQIRMEQMNGAQTRRAVRILQGRGPILGPSAKTGFEGVTQNNFLKNLHEIRLIILQMLHTNLFLFNVSRFSLVLFEKIFANVQKHTEN